MKRRRWTRVALAGRTVAIALTLLAYVSYAGHAPPKIRPQPDTAAFVMCGLLVPYLASLTISIVGCSPFAAAFEVLHLACGLALATVFAVGAAGQRIDGDVPEAITAVYPVAFTWLVQCACAFLSLFGAGTEFARHGSGES